MKNEYVIYARKSEENEDRQVQSIGDQLAALDKIVTERHLNVVKIFSESYSAKGPGRKAFNEMLGFINENNNIKGILCWAINRLTRNPIDTGRLQWLIQNGDIEEIVTPTRMYTEVDSDFVMAIEGAQANRFIRDLRKDTYRGVMSKVEKGMPPISAPAGYKNDKYADKGKKSIIPDPEQFPLVRKLFDQYMTGNFSVQQLNTEARRLGIKTNRGHNPLSKTQTYELLKNPFYMGMFRYAGKLYKGSYEAMLLPEEFELIQSMLSGKSKPKTRTHELLSGFIHCGICNRLITGEEKTKTQKNGNRHYFSYYACNGKRKGLCDQKPITGKRLVEQALTKISNIRIDPEFIDWAVDVLKRQEKEELKISYIRQEVANQDIVSIKQKLHNLFQLKISPSNTKGNLLSDEEYATEKAKLQEELETTQVKHTQSSQRYVDWISVAEKMFRYASMVQNRFNDAPILTKKSILKAFGSNLSIMDGVLEIELREPFYYLEKANKESNYKLEPIKNIDLTTEKGIFEFKKFGSGW